MLWLKTSHNGANSGHVFQAVTFQWLPKRYKTKCIKHYVISDFWTCQALSSLSLCFSFCLSSLLLVIICCCLGGTRSRFPPLPLHTWGNHPSCLQWSHQEPLLLWTSLNHLVSEALALSTLCFASKILTMCFSLYRPFLDFLPGAWLSCERVYWAEESWIPGGPFPLHVVKSMFWWPLN